MGSLYRRKLRNGEYGKYYWMKYYVNGKPIQESTKATTKREAQDVLDIRLGEKAKGSPIPPRLDRIQYDELARDLRLHYQTTGRRDMKEVEGRLAHLDKFFRGYRAVSIGPTQVTAYVAKRQEEVTRRKQPTSNRTINIELSLLKRMLRLAHENGKLLRVPPIKMLKEAPPRSGFFEEDQYRAVRRLLSNDLQVAVTVAYTFGWRIRSEVLTLRRSQVDLKAGTLRLDPGTTKNGQGRVVYVTPELRDLLTQQLQRVDRLAKEMGQVIPWVFPHLTGLFQGGRIKGFRRAWKTACRRAGVPWRIPHDFRRTAVRNMVNFGVPERVAMAISGHKTRSVFDRYHIVSPADLQEASRKMTVTLQLHSGQIGDAPLQASIQK